jgi:hypothetical protein
MVFGQHLKLAEGRTGPVNRAQQNGDDTSLPCLVPFWLFPESFNRVSIHLRILADKVEFDVVADVNGQSDVVIEEPDEGMGIE